MTGNALQLSCVLLPQRPINYEHHLGSGFAVTFMYALKTLFSLGDSSSRRKQVNAEKFNDSPKISIA